MPIKTHEDRLVSLKEVSAEDRPRAVQMAAEDMEALLRERFPGREGYRQKVTPANTGFGRDIRLTRGLNWGLYVIVRGTDQQLTDMQIRVGRESRLTNILGITGFLVGIALPGAVLLSDPRNINLPNGSLAVTGGLISGLVFALALQVITQPLLGLKPAVAQELAGTLWNARPSLYVEHSKV